MINEEMKSLLHFFYKQQMYANGDSFAPLNEEHGISNDVYSIAKEISKIIVEKIDEKKDDIYQSLNLTITEKTCEEIKPLLNTFTDKFKARIIIHPTGKQTSYGCFTYNRIGTDYNYDLQKFDSISIDGDFYMGHDNYGQAITALLSHELTHAYDDFNRKKRGKDIWLKAKEDGLGRLDNINGEYYQAILQAILYQTSTIERNGFVAQIMSEIKDMLPYCSSSSAALNCLRNNSITWVKRIEPIDDFMPFFRNMKDEGDRAYCINYYNHVTGKNIDNYNSFLRHINFRWERFKKKLMSQIGKQITDSAFKNPKWNSLAIDNLDDLRRKKD